MLEIAHASKRCGFFLCSSLCFLQIIGCRLTCFVPPTITGQPSSQTIAVGQPAFFTLAAAGSDPLSYQWLKDGVAIPARPRHHSSRPRPLHLILLHLHRDGKERIWDTPCSSPASLTVVTSGTGNVRFVAPNGNDSNAGTIDQPFLTIQHCATTVAQGSTCEVRAGTYRETVTPNSGVTITAYALEPVLIDGSDPSYRLDPISRVHF